MKHEHHQSNGKNSDGAARNCALIAHFPSETQAQHAAQVLADQAESIQVEEISSQQAQQELTTAPTGVSVVEIGPLAWIGLALGLLVGAVLGALVYLDRIALAGLAPALSAGPVAVSFLGAGLLGALGWFVGAVLHVFGAPESLPRHELRAAVPEEALPEVEQALVEAGAMEVLVSGDGAATPAASGHGTHHH
ncbi:MAG: hypothetical protein KJ077_02025 [Anaerolineae bacterium]|nr:hypothetical protein [Anaerolineae bacterium]GIK37078.1 MAG: hypothetical protein BroJett011_09110 [Chloroflexota bacterium]